MQKFISMFVVITLVIILASNTGFALSSSSNNTVGAIHGTNNTSKIRVVTSFFPIYEFVKKVGGDKVDASVFIPVGAEPHDFDPTIQQIQNTQGAGCRSSI
jgi:zinc transport system substrate-binding protein